MAIFKRFGRKGRKYPIRRDEEGRSARERCFELFDKNVPLPEISKAVGVKGETVRKYHQQWLKNPGIEDQLAYVKELLKNKSHPEREEMMKLVSEVAGVDREQIEGILHQPHGLRRLLTGKFTFPGRIEQDHKRYVALKFAFLISEHLIRDGKFEDVLSAFDRWMKWHQLRREDRDEDIEENNHRIVFIRRIIELEAENESPKSVRADRLSPRERQVFIRWGIEKANKEVEVRYWLRIGSLMADGLTTEQAREEMYQDLIQKGDAEGASKLRKYQDYVHPLKGEGPHPEKPGDGQSRNGSEKGQK